MGAWLRDLQGFCNMGTVQWVGPSERAVTPRDRCASLPEMDRCVSLEPFHISTMRASLRGSGKYV